MAKEKKGYEIIDRESEIDNLIKWIGECGQGGENDKFLMKEDLKMLMSWNCEFIYSSWNFNDYIEIK